MWSWSCLQPYSCCFVLVFGLFEVGSCIGCKTESLACWSLWLSFWLLINRVKITVRWMLKLKLNPIYLLSGSQTEPSVDSYLFCSAMYSSRSTATGTLLHICLLRSVASHVLLGTNQALTTQYVCVWAGVLCVFNVLSQFDSGIEQYWLHYFSLPNLY